MKIKISHQNEIHLLKLQTPTLEAIKEHVKKIFPNVGTDFTLAYTDQENDQITLSCQDDLQVLIDEGIQSIKIFVQPTQKQQQPQEYKKMVHSHHTCDGCQAYPIVGARFKCLECPNYDLCETCQEKQIHNEHKFFKISNFEELENYKREHCPQGWGRGFHGQGPCGFRPRGGHGPHGHFFKQMKELFQDPQFKDIKNNFCQIAQQAFSVLKTSMENFQTQQQQKETQNETQENKQDETQTQESQQVEQVEQQDIPKQQEEVLYEEDEIKVDQSQIEFQEKVKGLAQILDCQESLAKEYVEMFKELPLQDIIDIILNGK